MPLVRRCSSEPVDAGYDLAVWASAARRKRFRDEALATARLVLICLVPAFAAEHVLNGLLRPEALSAYVGNEAWWAVPFAVFVGAPAYVDGYAALPLTPRPDGSRHGAGCGHGFPRFRFRGQHLGRTGYLSGAENQAVSALSGPGNCRLPLVRLDLWRNSRLIRSGIETEQDCMAVKPPTFDGLRKAKQTGLNILDGEIMAEIASSIGRCGRAFEKALADLRDHDVHHSQASDGPARLVLVQQAADRAWALFIQYELAGLSTQKPAHQTLQYTR